MDIYKLKFTVLQQEILRFLFIKSGMSFNERALAKSLKVSPTAVSNSMAAMKKEGLIIVKKDESKRWSIELNRDSQKVMQLKRSDNLKQIYECGLSEILEKEFAGATIVLFGSYSRGEDTITSDIDLAVIGRKEKNVDITKFEKILGRKININFYDSLKDVHKNLKENICNGIVLAGGIEL